MSATLDYCPPTIAPRPTRRIAGAVTVAASCGLSAAAVASCVHDRLMLNTQVPGCGTGDWGNYRFDLITMPLAWPVLLGLVAVSYYCRFGVAASRASLWVAIVGWCLCAYPSTLSPFAHR